jgi:hypothetical protein
VVGSEQRVVESITDEVVKSIESSVEGQVVSVDRETLRYGDAFEPARGSGNGHKYE